MYYCHLFLIFSASVRSIPFQFFIVPIFAWNVPLVCLIFLKRSLVFPILLFSSISLHWSLRKAFLSLLAVLWNSAFRWVYLSFSPLPFASLLFSAICKPSSDSHFACLCFLFLGMVLITASCTMSFTSVHSSSGTLSISELKWTRTGKFNSNDHYIHYCGQESLRKNRVALIVSKRARTTILGCNLENARMISICFQGKPFNITVIQVYAPTTNAKEAEVEQFCEDLQDFLELTPKMSFFIMQN